MQTRLSWIAIAAACVVGCSEYLGPPSSPDYWKAKEQPATAQSEDSEEEESTSEDQHSRPAAAPSESGTVVIVQQAEEAPRPRARSISLGYMGDGVLAGGITRDTVIPPKQPQDPYALTNWQGYVNAPKWRSAGPQFRPSEAATPWVRLNSRGKPWSFTGAVPGCGCGCAY